ncbi:hypothetical protein Tco_0590258 [Tanacetum coccineum]
MNNWCGLMGMATNGYDETGCALSAKLSKLSIGNFDMNICLLQLVEIKIDPGNPPTSEPKNSQHDIDFLENDVVEAVNTFFNHGNFPKDDAVFLGHWSDSNIDTILRILDCFYHALGLKINMSKSKLMGRSVHRDNVTQAAQKIGFQAPFS